MNRFEFNEKTGELKVFTDTGYFSVEPYGEGVSVMLYDKNNIDGISQDEDGLLGIDLALVEKHEGKHQAIIWEDSSNENSTKKIEYKINLKK